MKSTVVLFFFSVLLIGTDTMLTAPLLPILAPVFHADPRWAGWMVSAYALGFALFALFAGPWSDQKNRRGVILTGMAGFALATLAGAWAWDFGSMVVFRALAGVSAALVTPQIWASIPQIFPREKAGKAFSLAAGGLAAAQILGIPFSSFLAYWSWQLPFYLLSGLAGILWFLHWKFLPSITPVHSQPQVGIKMRYWRLLKNHPLRVSLAAYFLFQWGNYAVFIFMGSWLASVFALDVRQIGLFMLVLGTGNLAGSLAGPLLVKRWGTPLVLGTALVVMAGFFCLIPLVPSPLLGMAGFFTTFFLFGVSFPLMMGRLQGLAPESRGTVTSTANAAMYGAATLSGAWGGPLFAGAGYPAVGLASGLVILAAVIAGALVWKRERKPVSADQAEA